LTEGELQKQIIKAYEDADAGGSYWDNLAEINKTFDLAKQEIYNLLPELENPKIIGVYEELVKNGVATNYVKLVLTIRKWFGDSS
jgi:hypothetical protein